MDPKFVVLKFTSANYVSAYGTKTGRAFKSQDAAERMSRRLERDDVALGNDYMVIELKEAPDVKS